MQEYKFELNTFIGGWFIPHKICENLIKFYKKNKKKHIRGLTGNGLKEDIKASTDLTISCYDNALNEYNSYLRKCLKLYIKKYPELNEHSRFETIENYNIQYYKPKEGFKEFHCERNGGVVSGKRLLVFMTYLNNVPDGGTEFMYQNLISPAKKGLTLIWPAEFTHRHKCQISNKNEKYIITGWYSYL